MTCQYVPVYFQYARLSSFENCSLCARMAWSVKEPGQGQQTDRRVVFLEQPIQGRLRVHVAFLSCPLAGQESALPAFPVMEWGALQRLDDALQGLQSGGLCVPGCLERLDGSCAPAVDREHGLVGSLKRPRVDLGDLGQVL
jgi:hypothetical protein